MLTSSTPEKNLVAFAWLPLDRWTPENLFEPISWSRDGKFMCKVCDEFHKREDQTKHIRAHVEEEKERVARRKAEEAAKREQEKEWQRAEDAAIRENIRAVEGKPAKPSKPRRINKAAKSKAEVVSALADYFEANGEATLAVLTEALGIEKSVIRNQIANVEGIGIVGQVKSGQRGRPAVIYGKEK